MYLNTPRGPIKLGPQSFERMMERKRREFCGIPEPLPEKAQEALLSTIQHDDAFAFSLITALVDYLKRSPAAAEQVFGELQAVFAGGEPCEA